MIPAFALSMLPIFFSSMIYGTSRTQLTNILYEQLFRNCEIKPDVCG